MLKAIKLALLSCLIVAPIFLKANADELKIGYVNMERVMRDAPVARNNPGGRENPLTSVQ